jgi:hypothetical protein
MQRFWTSEVSMKVKYAQALSLVAAAALFSLLVGAPAAHAANIKSVKEWTGQVEDAKLEKEWPNASPITNKDDFAKVWKSWRGKEEVPDIDFDKEVVLVSTNKKGQISDLLLVDQKGGNFVSTGTIDAKPVKGFTYALTVFKRAGIKTINGKPVKERAWRRAG